MEKKVSLNINGYLYRLTVPANRLLVDLLREDLGLMGTKVSCREGECGCCTVLVNGKAVCSCLTLVVEIDGGEVTTIEDLAKEFEAHKRNRH